MRFKFGTNFGKYLVKSHVYLKKSKVTSEIWFFYIPTYTISLFHDFTSCLWDRKSHEIGMLERFLAPLCEKMVEKNNYPWRSVSGANEARSQLSILPNSKCPRFFGCKSCRMVGPSTEAARKAPRALQGPILRQALIKALALFQMTVLSLLASKGFVTIFGAATTTT